MALSLFSKLYYFLTSFMLLSSIAIASAREFSIVGYSPDDLTCIDKLINLFESWTQKHGKKYESVKEKLHRFEIFKDNLKHIDERIKVVSNYWLGLNEFADMSHDEFKKMYLGFKPDHFIERNDQSHKEFKYMNVEDLPESVDWRTRGAVSPVKNQGPCGDCWAFSAVAAVEGINQIVKKKLIALSEQELVDCDTSFNKGCDGGLMNYAFTYIVVNGGLRKEEEYPYKAKNGTCKGNEDNSELVTISGFDSIPAYDEQSLLKAVAHQPISVAIEASGKDFQFYEGGVFDGECGTDLDHGVTAVGYELDYITVKNSWGVNWGEEGYIRMKAKTGKPAGTCGINMMASFPRDD
ncbi:Cysteine protease xcp2 [Orobanche minor]